MKYDISKKTAPKMPTLGKGTECIKILLSQASKDMHEPLVPMLFPILGAHVSGAEFQYPDLTWKELCGQMANLVAESGGNKGQLSHLVEAICRDFRQHDDHHASLSQGRDGRWYFCFSLDEDQLAMLPQKLVRQASSIAKKVLQKLLAL